MSKQATVVRVVTPDHLPPWSVKAKDLLQRGGFAVEDRHLTTKKANEVYKKENGYDETPQDFRGGQTCRRLRRVEGVFG